MTQRLLMRGLLFCTECGSRLDFWTCFICGNVGRGRQKGHYELVSHRYALELATQRVWDHAGDNYVHQLFQNKAYGREYGNLAMQYSQIFRRATEDQPAVYDEQTSKLRRRLTQWKPEIFGENAEQKVLETGAEHKMRRAGNEGRQARLEKEKEKKKADDRVGSEI
ncbi:hypothetical protein DFH11DRAFT_1548207 [Phellopilus nigrolimitatus]|nr:hypothetical protein DFH11DRAFT_1548207 [Phellopilus nigrolimitatus]